ERMVFVDEEACIGCTSCATLATQTFLMDDAHGRARAFSQAGDTDEIIEEAIATCPVDCIHYVPWDELVSLERLR
ncbi:4Fe-4S single cluster domain-containing protein, partial [Pelagophyceae sp. CCMP2097]